MTTIRDLIEKAVPALIAAGVIAAVTATYQFAQMRVELEVLKAGQTRVEAKVDALISRQAWYHGPEEEKTLHRMAAVPASPVGGVAFAAEKP